MTRLQVQLKDLKYADVFYWTESELFGGYVSKQLPDAQVTMIVDEGDDGNRHIDCILDNTQKVYINDPVKNIALVLNFGTEEKSMEDIMKTNMRPSDNWQYDYYMYHLEDNNIRRCIYDNTMKIEKKMEQEEEFDYEFIIPDQYINEFVKFDIEDLVLTGGIFIENMIFKMIYWRYRDYFAVVAKFADDGIHIKSLHIRSK